jgi:hypothetical protein
MKEQSALLLTLFLIYNLERLLKIKKRRKADCYQSSLWTDLEG